MAVQTRSSKILIVGDSHNVVKQFPMFGKGAPLYWWHEKGYIHWEDSRPKGSRPTNYYGLMGWREFATRVVNLSEMIIKSSEDRRWGTERRLMQEFISEAEKLIREAKAHGGLLDKGASQQHRKKRASVVVPRSFPTVVVGNGDVDKLAVGQGKMEDPFGL